MRNGHQTFLEPRDLHAEQPIAAVGEQILRDQKARVGVQMVDAPLVTHKTNWVFHFSSLSLSRLSCLFYFLSLLPIAITCLLFSSLLFSHFLLALSCGVLYCVTSSSISPPSSSPCPSLSRFFPHVKRGMLQHAVYVACEET